MIKNLLTNAGDIRDSGLIPRSGGSLGQEDPPEDPQEGMTTYSSILA